MTRSVGVRDRLQRMRERSTPFSSYASSKRCSSSSSTSSSRWRNAWVVGDADTLQTIHQLGPTRVNSCHRAVWGVGLGFLCGPGSRVAVGQTQAPDRAEQFVGGGHGARIGAGIGPKRAEFLTINGIDRAPPGLSAWTTAFESCGTRAAHSQNVARSKSTSPRCSPRLGYLASVRGDDSELGGGHGRPDRRAGPSRTLGMMAASAAGGRRATPGWSPSSKQKARAFAWLRC